ncbi:hypothetical protein [Corynebacterium cystitidis]|uniref:hypothetical protein n=1 Tax=Corynebacterium cystitidis TaxID=35757 RepID=UPI00211E1E46|nr:hypothetical protein [Corynebacterium cystitidis]
MSTVVFWKNVGQHEDLTELSGNWKEHARNIFTSAANAISVTTGGLKVSPQVGEAASKAPSGVGRQLQKALIAAGQAAHGAGKGLVIFIDEVQAADPEGIRALAYAWQHMQSEAQDVPIMAVTAGLSHAQDVITHAVSFAERFLYQQLHNLEEDDSVAALRSPAQRAGVRWEDEALNVALASTKGYPYFLQVIGDETWKSAGYPKEGETIRLPHINDASENFNHTRESFFRTRWEKATPGENDFLMAMAALGDGAVARKDVAARMGKSTTDISMVRVSLMDNE